MLFAGDIAQARCDMARDTEGSAADGLIASRETLVVMAVAMSVTKPLRVLDSEQKTGTHSLSK